MSSHKSPLNEDHMAEELRQIKAPVYACLGNHEFYAGESDALRFYQEAGIRLLWLPPARPHQLLRQ